MDSAVTPVCPTAGTQISTSVLDACFSERTHAAALAYAARGWRVFPCQPRGKRPLVKSWPDVATFDGAQIANWWEQWPDANVACVTGPASGFFVLDVDVPDGPASLAALEAEHSPLPATLEQATGSGGMHLLFRWPEGRSLRNSAGKLGPGLDVRADGGYVIAPPSIHPETGCAYAWPDPDAPIAEAPAWLLDLACEDARRTRA